MQSPKTLIQHSFLPQLLLLALLVPPPAIAGGVDQELPAGEPLKVELWSADLWIHLEPGAVPHLKAEAVLVREDSGEATPTDGPTVELLEDSSGLRILRLAESETVRLRVELTLDLLQPLKVTGRDLDVVVKGPPLDFRKMAMRRLQASERGAELEAPLRTDVSLRIEDSRADLSGITGATLEGRNSWFVVRQSANELTVQLAGGAAELTSHRGLLHLESEGGDIELKDVKGEIDFRVAQSSFEISNGEGKLEGETSNGAELQLYDWGGHLDVTSSKSLLELRNFRPGSQLLNVLADDSNVTLEAIESGQLDISQKGGRLRVLDVQGKMRLHASHQAEVELERLIGTWKTTADDSTVVVDEVDRFEADLSDAELQLRGATDLRLTATGSEITAAEIGKVSQAVLTDTSADLELTAGSRAQIDARGQSWISVRLPIPCFVLTPPQARSGGEASPKAEKLDRFDVTGCTIGADIGHDRNSESTPPSFITLALDDLAELQIRGL